MGAGSGSNRNTLRGRRSLGGFARALGGVGVAAKGTKKTAMMRRPLTVSGCMFFHTKEKNFLTQGVNDGKDQD